MRKMMAKSGPLLRSEMYRWDTRKGVKIDPNPIDIDKVYVHHKTSNPLTPINTD